MRARDLAAAVAALALGAGVAACGGQQVSDAAPATTPPITVSQDDLAGLSGGDDPTLQDRTTATTGTTATTPADTTGETGTAAPDTGAVTPPADTATPPAETPAPDASAGTGDTGGATEDPPPADTGDTGDSGDTGGAGFQDFCQQNPGAC